jgi:long-chain acyl-CoA synthetase
MPTATSDETPSLGLQILGNVLTVLDFLIWILTLGPVWMLMETSKRKSTTQIGSRAIVVNELGVNGAGAAKSKVFRHVSSAGKMASTLTGKSGESLTTVWDTCQHSYKHYAGNPALGTRQLLSLDHKLHPKFPTKVFGETRWLTFEKVGENAVNFGKGLKSLGMTSLNMKAGDDFDAQKGAFTMLLYENSCAEWFQAMQGAFSQSIVVSTAYATLGVEAVEAAVNEGGMVTVFCNKTNVKLIADKASQMPTLKNIIYTYDQCVPEDRQTKAEGKSGLNILSFDEVVEKGKSQNMSTTPPQPHDVAILMYTSGSTGKPKGVVIRHKHVVATGSGLLTHLPQIPEIQGGSFVGYLPLAHIFEIVVEISVFFLGHKIGYADPKTLTAGPGQCMPTGGLDHFKPTVLCGVPKVWETIKTKGDLKVGAGSAVAKFIFATAFKVKSKAMVSGRYTPLFNLLVFRKFQAITGGNLKMAVSGGGGIAGEVQEWIRTCMDCPLVQGYGLTETAMGLTVQMLDDFRLGVVGSPLSSCEYLVHSEPDICDSEGNPYMAADTIGVGGVSCLGRGEVWVRGNNISSGYYKMPQQTKEAFREDGFFMTGDIGMVLPDGSIKIIDRKKNLVKLKGGEYVALEKMNQAFNSSPFVNKEAGGTCAYADDSLDRPVCLVQADESAIMAKAKELGISGDYSSVCSNPKMTKVVLDSLNAEGKKVGLAALEVLAGVGLLSKPWSAEDGTLTATLKLVPSRIKEVFKKELEVIKPMGRR